MWFSHQTKVQWNDLFVSFYAEQRNVCEKLTIFLIYMNTCWVPHLQMNPKCLTVATIVLSSLHLHTTLNKWPLLYTALFEFPPKSWHHCLVVTWLVPRETAAVLAQVLCTSNSHAPVYSVTLFKATCMYAACLFSWNLLPALLAEWLGSFICYCSNTDVEWIQK